MQDITTKGPFDVQPMEPRHHQTNPRRRHVHRRIGQD